MLGKRVRAERERELQAPHMAKLREFVQGLRRKTGKDVPDLDPRDGGTEAEVMFLFEAPGRKARDSGFVSRNNPDETASNFFTFNRAVELPRQQTISWNIVPWYVGSKGKLRPPTHSDCEKGIEYLLLLLKVLPKLRAVVFVGQTAQRAVIPVANLRKYELFLSPHPSPQFINRNKKKNRKQIIDVLREVKQYLRRLKQSSKSRSADGQIFG